MPALPEAERARLEAAYRATTYRVFAPEGVIDLRIGQASPALAALLREGDVGVWAILSACNPRSIQQNEAANHTSQAQLEVWLSERGYRWLPGANVADAGDWPAEASCFVLDMPESAALERGVSLLQNAVVTGDCDALPRLLWCR